MNVESESALSGLPVVSGGTISSSFVFGLYAVYENVRAQLL